MYLAFRLLRKAVAWADFVALTVFIYLLAWLPWQGRHPVARRRVSLPAH